jgi:hypothetical protein
MTQIKAEFHARTGLVHVLSSWARAADKRKIKLRQRDADPSGKLDCVG